MNAITFPSLRSAISFVRGYCVPRVVVFRRGLYEIVSPRTARRHGLRTLWPRS